MSAHGDDGQDILRELHLDDDSSDSDAQEDGFSDAGDISGGLPTAETRAAASGGTNTRTTTAVSERGGGGEARLQDSLETERRTKTFFGTQSKNDHDDDDDDDHAPSLPRRRTIGTSNTTRPSSSPAEATMVISQSEMNRRRRLQELACSSSSDDDRPASATVTKRNPTASISAGADLPCPSARVGVVSATVRVDSAPVAHQREPTEKGSTSLTWQSYSAKGGSPVPPVPPPSTAPVTAAQQQPSSSKLTTPAVSASGSVAQYVSQEELIATTDLEGEELVRLIEEANERYEGRVLQQQTSVASSQSSTISNRAVRQNAITDVVGLVGEDRRGAGALATPPKNPATPVSAANRIALGSSSPSFTIEDSPAAAAAAVGVRDAALDHQSATTDISFVEEYAVTKPYVDTTAIAAAKIEDTTVTSSSLDFTTVHSSPEHDYGARRKEKKSQRAPSPRQRQSKKDTGVAPIDASTQQRKFSSPMPEATKSIPHPIERGATTTTANPAAKLSTPRVGVVAASKHTAGEPAAVGAVQQQKQRVGTSIVGPRSQSQQPVRKPEATAAAAAAVDGAVKTHLQPAPAKRSMSAAAAATAPPVVVQHQSVAKKPSDNTNKSGSSSSSYAALQDMYRRAMRHREHQESKREQERNRAHHVEEKQCTFHPEISTKARKGPHKRTPSAERRFLQEVAERRERRLQQERDAKRLEQSQCTFQPAIEPVSAALVMRSRSTNPTVNTSSDDNHSTNPNTKAVTLLPASERLHRDSQRRAVELANSVEVNLKEIQGARAPPKRSEDEIMRHVSQLHDFQRKRDESVHRLLQEEMEAVQRASASCNVFVDPDAVVQRLLHRSSSIVSSSVANDNVSTSSRAPSTSSSPVKVPKVNAISRELADRRRRFVVERWFEALGGVVDSNNSDGIDLNDVSAVIRQAPPLLPETREFCDVLRLVREDRQAAAGTSSLQHVTLAQFAAVLYRIEKRLGPQPWSWRTPEECIKTLVAQRSSENGDIKIMAAGRPTEAETALHERLYSAETCATKLKRVTHETGKAASSSGGGKQSDSLSILLNADVSSTASSSDPLSLFDGVVDSKPHSSQGVRRQHQRYTDPSQATAAAVSTSKKAAVQHHQHGKGGGVEDDILDVLNRAIVERTTTTAVTTSDSSLSFPLSRVTTPPRRPAQSSLKSTRTRQSEDLQREDESTFVEMSPSVERTISSPLTTPPRSVASSVVSAFKEVTNAGTTRADKSASCTGKDNNHHRRRKDALADSEDNGDVTEAASSDLLLRCAQLDRLTTRVISSREERERMEALRLQKLREMGRKMAAAQLAGSSSTF